MLKAIAAGQGGGGGAVSSVSNSDGSILVSPNTGNAVVSINPANSNTYTAQQNFNGGLEVTGQISQSGTTNITSGTFTQDSFYVAALPSSASSATYNTASFSVQYNSTSSTSGAVNGVYSKAELYGQGSANQTTGVVAYAQSDASGGAYSGTASLYGSRVGIFVNGTSTFNHGIGLKAEAPVCNGVTSYTSGVYIQDQTNLGTSTITSQDAIHIEGSGAINSIGFGNGSSAINASIYSPSSGIININATNGLTLNGNPFSTPAQALGGRIVTASGTVNIANADSIVEIQLATPAAVSVALQASPTNWQIFTIKDGAGNAATFPITITPNAGTIDGFSTYVITNNWDSVDIYYNGTSWRTK